MPSNRSAKLATTTMPPGPSPISDFAQHVIDEVAKYCGASPQDIDLDDSLTADLELRKDQIEDLIRYLSETFKLNFEDLKGPYKTVGDIAEAIEDLSSFE